MKRWSKRQREAALLSAAHELLVAIQAGMLQAYDMDYNPVPRDRFITVTDLLGHQFKTEDMDRLWPEGEPPMIERLHHHTAGRA